MREKLAPKRSIAVNMGSDGGIVKDHRKTSHRFTFGVSA